MLDSKTIKLLGGPNKNKIVEVPVKENSIVVLEKFNEDQLMIDFYDGKSSDIVLDNIEEFKYVDSGIKDQKFNYFIPEDKQWFDYKKLRDIYYSQTPF